MAGTPVPPTAEPTFFDHIDRYRDKDRESSLSEAREYWAQKLAGLPELELPTRRSAGPPSLEGATHRFALKPSAVDAIRGLATREGVSPFVVLTAAFSTPPATLRRRP